MRRVPGPITDPNEEPLGYKVVGSTLYGRARVVLDGRRMIRIYEWIDTMGSEGGHGWRKVKRKAERNEVKKAPGKWVDFKPALAAYRKVYEP